MNTKSTFINMTVKTPFTSIFPRFNNWHAVQALNQLDDFLVLDTETTGVGKNAEMCELAIVDFKTGTILFNSLLHPYNLDGYESSKAREVNGISTQELYNAPPLPETWSDILKILQSKHLTSFNTQFDIPMIRNSAMKWDLEVPPLDATCLMKLSMAFLNLDFWPNLDEVASYFCVDTTARHRALGDVLTTIEIVKKMKLIASGLK